MSMGERSCKFYGSCEKDFEPHKCNVDCDYYKWDKITPQDTVSAKGLNVDIIRSWFFEKKEDAREDNILQAGGYARVTDGVLVERWGNTNLPYAWTEWGTKIGRFRSPEIDNALHLSKDYNDS